MKTYKYLRNEKMTIVFYLDGTSFSVKLTKYGEIVRLPENVGKKFERLNILKEEKELLLETENTENVENVETTKTIETTENVKKTETTKKERKKRGRKNTKKE